MKKLLISISTLSYLLLGACSSGFDYGEDFNESIDFTKYRSYRWHGGNEFNLESMQYIASDLTDQRIRGEVDRALAAKGIRLREEGPVDFYVNYTITSTDRVDINTYNTYSGYAPGWGYGYGGLGPYRYGSIGYSSAYGGYGAGGTETRVTEYTQGTFILDFVEVASDQLVWRGVVEGKMDTTASQSSREESTIVIVQRILSNFPPGSEE